MPNKLYNDDSVKAIANAIRSKLGTTAKYTVSQMASAINSIVTEPDLEEITITPSESQQTKTPAKYGFSKVIVNAISNTFVGSGITRRTSTDMTASGASVTAPAGYYATAQSKSVASGSVTVSEPTVSAGGLITAGATVSAGYVSQNPSNKTKQLTTQAAKTVTPTKAEQTAVASGVYTTGAVKVGAIPAQYIVPTGSKDITENGTNIDVSAYSTVNVNVPTSGGGGKNVQAYFGVNSVSATAYTATNTKLTVAKTGTYKVSWMGWRSTNSGTSGSQLYIDNSAYGSANTTFTNTYGHRVELPNVSLTAGQEIVVRARARSTSYVMAVGNLIIEEV